MLSVLRMGLMILIVINTPACDSKLENSSVVPENGGQSKDNAQDGPVAETDPASGAGKLTPEDIAAIEFDSMDLLAVAPGKTVEIRGKNFKPGMQALVNNVEVELQVASPTKATFVMPEGTGIGLVDIKFKSGSVEIISTKQFSLVSTSTSDSLPILLIDPTFICEDVTFRDAAGDIKTGLRECVTIDDCTEEGQIDCRTTADAKSTLIADLAAKVAVGSTVAGVAGQALIKPADCASDGAIDCVATASFKAAMIAGLATKVTVGSTVAGVAGQALIKPADCATDGAIDCVTTASFKAAKMANFTSSSIQDSVQIAGVTGTLDLGNLVAGNIKRGVVIAGVTGTFPSAAAPLPRFANDGFSAAVQSDAVTTDFTSFTTQLTSAGSFEFWDSAGVRRTGSGDADITAANIKDTVALENLSITGSYFGGGPYLDVWDVRAGVDRGDGQSGKLKVNCRNVVNTSRYNYDGVIGSIPTSAVSTGTVMDWWDTTTDANGFPASTGVPAGWSVNKHYCGGIETVANDDNVWRDTTVTGCNATSCRYLDKITGLEWTKTVQTSRSWPDSINDCNSLSHDGVNGWRLPTQKEWMSAYQHGIMSLAHANFITSSQMTSGWFWTGTTRSDAQSYAMIFQPGSGASDYNSNDAKNLTYKVACVR